MEYILLSFSIILLVIQLIILLKPKTAIDYSILNDLFKSGIGEIKNELNQQLKSNREELSHQLSVMQNSIFKNFIDHQENQSKLFKGLREELMGSFKVLSEHNDTQYKDLKDQVRLKLDEAINKNDLLRTEIQNRLDQIKETIEKRLELLQNGNEKKLDEMRKTVDEKLQSTLNERLGKSFEIVNKQLESVQKGLGEMQTLAQDVGGLKKVLSNVKIRGGIGEVQLGMLLEQMLAPEQYAANVKTKEGSDALVEYAIKLPGKEEKGKHVLLPIDAKFPKEPYEQLLSAYEVGDIQQVELANKNIDQVIKKMAKDIKEKYLDPPNTTEFAILFLPFESVYAEVRRRSDLIDQLQSQYRVIITGPTTLAAILNSLQMGFRTLALQKRSSEVWEVLSAVKKEFGNFSGLLEKAQKNIHQAGNHIDDLLGKRTRAITRKLKNVELGATQIGLLDEPEDEFTDESEEETN